MIKRQVAEENEYVKLSLNELKTFFPKKEVLYRLLEGETYNLYLPDFKSSVITNKYLLKLTNKECYSLSKEKHRKSPEP